MAYNFPNDRRRFERRAAPVAPYAGPDRRVTERRVTEVKLVRKPEPMHRGVLWTAVFMVMVVADSIFLDGAYRHMAIGWVTGMADAARYTTEHLWDWGH